MLNNGLGAGPDRNIHGCHSTASMTMAGGTLNASAAAATHVGLHWWIDHTCIAAENVPIPTLPLPPSPIFHPSVHFLHRVRVDQRQLADAEQPGQRLRVGTGGEAEDLVGAVASKGRFPHESARRAG